MKALHLAILYEIRLSEKDILSNGKLMFILKMFQLFGNLSLDDTRSALHEDRKTVLSQYAYTFNYEEFFQTFSYFVKEFH